MSHPDIFNGGDGIVETSVLVPGLVVIVSELESGVLSAAECTCAGVDGDIEILKFEVAVGVGDGDCSGSSFLSSAVTGVSEEEKLSVAQPTVVDMEICGGTALHFFDEDKHSLLEVFEFRRVLIFIACSLFLVDATAASFLNILFPLAWPDIAFFFVALFRKKACTQTGDMLLTGTLL